MIAMGIKDNQVSECLLLLQLDRCGQDMVVLPASKQQVAGSGP